MIGTPSDHEITLTRLVGGRPSLVFDAWTKPELLKRWFFAPRGWDLSQCDVQLEVGGAYRFVWRRAQDGLEMALTGIYCAVSPFDRLVYTARFDVPWFPGESLITLHLAREGEKTRVLCTLFRDSLAARDAIVKMPIEGGIADGFVRLDELLTELRK